MTFVQFIAEKKRAETTYGCVMLGANIPKWKSHHLSLINKDDIFQAEGLEKDPHVTILFGIHEDTANPQAVLRMVEQIQPVTVTIDTISLFENDAFDVVKYTVPTDKVFVKLRKQLMDTFEHTVTFPKYQPHMTIGYVIKGTGAQYAGKVTPFDVKFNIGMYSHHTIPNDKESRKQLKVNLK